MRVYRGVDVYIHTYMTSALVGGEWSASRPGHFIPGERAPGSHWIGGCVDPRVSMEDKEKRKFLTLLGIELRFLGRPASSQSLYQLRYPGSNRNSSKINLIRINFIKNEEVKSVSKKCKTKYDFRRKWIAQHFTSQW
jgi:hypothetical protein